jgi:hypothetical protein
VISISNQMQNFLGVEARGAARRKETDACRVRSDELNGQIELPVLECRTPLSSRVLALGVLLAMRDFESAAPSVRKRPREIFAPAVEKVKSHRAQRRPVEDVRAVDRAAGCVIIGRNTSAAIEQSKHLDSAATAGKPHSNKGWHAQLPCREIRQLDRQIGPLEQVTASQSAEACYRAGALRQRTRIFHAAGLWPRVARIEGESTEVMQPQPLRKWSCFNAARIFALGDVSARLRPIGAL